MPASVRNRSLADGVFAHLVDEILAGRYPPGMTLPPERALTQLHGVNRHVIREALKRLEQLGLVATAQGEGTRVLDYRSCGGVAILPLLGQHLAGTAEGFLLWRSVSEMRAAMAVDMVRLCALRAPPQVKEDLCAIAAELESTSEHEALYDLEVKFWYRIADGCKNLAYRLALNGLVRGTEIDAKFSRRWAAWETQAASYRVPLAAHIAASEVDAAEGEARRTMRAALASFCAHVLSNEAATEFLEVRAPSRSEPPRFPDLTGALGPRAASE